MTIAGKMRLYLIILGVLPSFMVIAAVYFYSLEESDRSLYYSASRNLERFRVYDNGFKGNLLAEINRTVHADQMPEILFLLKTGRSSRADLSSIAFNLDFAEILDDSGIVKLSAARPGFVGEKISGLSPIGDSAVFRPLLEYDAGGVHASYSYTVPLNNEYYLYAGKYLDSLFFLTAGQFLNADIEFIYGPALIKSRPFLTGAEPLTLNRDDRSLYSLVAGGISDDFALVAYFNPLVQKKAVVSLLSTAAVIGIIAISLAVIFGFVLTGRLRREMNNIIEATSKIAAGDLTAPVIPLENDEFAELADEFNKMKARLKKSYQDLAAAEQTAAWKAMGQKMAHEIKNPLTPISISVDDLQRSYHENLPDFDNILDGTTAVIKSEIVRLTRLLDQFVKFARMSPPEIKLVETRKFIGDIRTLYSHEIESGRISIINNSSKKSFKFDAGQIKQLIINLVKNGLESSPDATVLLLIQDSDGGLEIDITDTGPGFAGSLAAGDIRPRVSSKSDGSGLGLVIVQRIVHEHEGSIELYNNDEGGAGVKVILPG